jgi:ribonucleoside-diphosphate reductase alpha chain
MESGNLTYFGLNSQLNIYDKDGNIQFDKDKQAARAFFLEHVNPNTHFFHDQEERLGYLIENDHYEADFLNKYSKDFVLGLFKRIYDKKFRFDSFVGAYKFYTAYALKTNDGSRYLERYEDRIVAVALYLADGIEKRATALAEEMIAQRYQPATPTFLNAGKAQRGELVSCFLLEVQDSMNSIEKAVGAALQLSKRGGGVAFNMTSVRAAGDPIKGKEGQSSGIIGPMKLLEDAFSYSNQLGARQGAGAVYLNVHHMDIETFLDSRREAADEKIRIKTLSLGVVVPDITLQLAANNEDMYLFSPYDVAKKYGKPFADVNITEVYRELVEDPNIRKRAINARRFFQSLAEVQFEAGYPYIMFEDNVNKANNIKGKIKMSNLCSEILQVSEDSVVEDGGTYSTMGKDISCNLGSLNIAKVMQSPNFGKTIDTAVRALTFVSDSCDIRTSPTIAAGNQRSHAIGLGQMNLHGYLAQNEIEYGSYESIDFVSTYFAMIAYHTIYSSTRIAKEREQSFDGFEDSKYASGEYFTKYTEQSWAPKTDKVTKLFEDAGIKIPTQEQWKALMRHVAKYGMYHQNLQAVAPTGSISYVNNSTSSIHPITSKVEIRKEGKLGRVYYAAPGMRNDNLKYYKDAYELGPQAVIDVYAAATEHVDQGLSLTLFFDEDATTRTINQAQVYAWSKGIKTIYYVRVKNTVIEGTDMEGCVSCAV